MRIISIILVLISLLFINESIYCQNNFNDSLSSEKGIIVYHQELFVFYPHEKKPNESSFEILANLNDNVGLLLRYDMSYDLPNVFNCSDTIRMNTEDQWNTDKYLFIISHVELSTVYNKDIAKFDGASRLEESTMGFSVNDTSMIIRFIQPTHYISAVNCLD